jgi:hypothetical protein
MVNRGLHSSHSPGLRWGRLSGIRVRGSPGAVDWSNSMPKLSSVLALSAGGAERHATSTVELITITVVTALCHSSSVWVSGMSPLMA